jgi:hypothetical protein
MLTISIEVSNPSLGKSFGLFGFQEDQNNAKEILTEFFLEKKRLFYLFLHRKFNQKS